ncbi:MAG: VOC family protein [Myxococcales bacterium]|jgi:hypothetical protein
MTLRIRQLALVARDLDPVVQRLCDALGVDVCYRDPGVGHFGLHNAVMAIGDTFLEVVSPTEDGTTAGRLLERRGGDGGYMVLLQTDDLAADRRRFARLGVREVWDIELEDISAVHLHPKDVGATIVSFDQPAPPESWRWGGPEWHAHRHVGRVRAIVGAELQASDPAAVAARWSQVLDLPSRAEGDDRVIDVNGGTLRFVPDEDGRGDGLRTVVMRRAKGAMPRDLTLCGTRFHFVD